MSAARRALLEKWSRGERTDAGAVAPRAAPDRLAELSYKQLGLWLAEHVDGPTQANVAAFCIRVAGPLDVETLRRALRELVERHEILRTRFVQRDAQPVADVAPAAEPDLALEDLPSASPDAVAHAARIARDEIARAFDFAQAPLMRARVLRAATDDHYVLLFFHHLVFDGWSAGVVGRELVARYEALRDGPEPGAPAPRMQYADFAAWQRSQVASGAWREGLAHWLEQLAGAPPPASLPVDRAPPPGGHVRRWATHRFRVGGELTDAIRARARAADATPFALLLAAYNVLLARMTGQHDVTVGLPFANRERPETAELIGPLVNVVPLRTDLGGRPTFRALLTRVAGTLAAAYRHQGFPYEAVQEHLRELGQPHRALPYRSWFVLQNFPFPRVERGAATFSAAGLGTDAVQFGRMPTDWGVAFIENGSALEGLWEYDSTLFDAASVARFARHFVTLLEDATRHPDRPIARLALLTPAERSELLVRWNGARDDEVDAPGLHQLVEQQAARAPDARAVACEGRALTYRELNARANQLAHALRRRGVAPGARVALCLERSVEMVVAMLAVLKAGAAYVPLDPGYPRERLAFLLDDARPVALIAQRALDARLPAWDGPRVDVDDAAAVADESRENPDAAFAPAQGAYVIYTSGSTGQPKGVVVSHHSVARLLRATDAWFHFGPDDVWTCFHSYAFDFSVWEIWGALATGGRVVVVPYLTSRTPDAFRRLVADQGVTVLNQTPSAFRQFAQADELAQDGPPLALRVVIFGGEALELQSLAGWVSRHGDARPRLVNMYGITETTVHVTYRPIVRADLAAGRGSVIGVPIPDLRLYVLDDALAPSPLGVAGELYVGGPGVARGYLRRPSLTAQRFVPDPFATRPGQRLYRTGDLARRRDDGELEYLGRIDDQVKIRGFRIELGEVEGTLARQPGVRACAVVARRDPASGEARLVAYWTGDAVASELRGAAERALPQHMVPSAFVRLEALPLTANGKLDARSLPEPEAARPELGTAFAPPETPLQQALAEVWASLLGVARVGLDDNFFALGGDSIRGLAIVHRSRARGARFALGDLFRTPTLRALTATTGDAVAEAEAAGPAPFALLSAADRARLPPGLDDAYPLTALQQGMLFHASMAPGGTTYHDVFTIDLGLRFVARHLAAALRELTAEHPVLRTSFDLARFDAPLALVHHDADVPFDVVDLRADASDDRAAQVQAFLELERRTPFDLARGPLLRLFAHLVADDRVRFSLSFHHAILDGWSVASFNTELFRRYAAHARGAPLPLDPPAMSFAAHVAAERDGLASGDALAWWRAALGEARVASLGGRAAAAPFETAATTQVVLEQAIEPALVASLEAVARALGVPLKSVLLAAHARVVALLSGEHDFTTGVVASGRPEHDDAARTLGLFLTTLPFRFRQQRGATWTDGVRDALATEAAALAHRHLPLAELQRAHGGPLFDVVFNYIHFHVYGDVAAESGVAVFGAEAVEETNFALVVQFHRDPARHALTLTLTGDAARFDRAALATIAGYHARALGALASAPTAPRDEAPLLDAAERQRVLDAWNATDAARSTDATIHGLVAAQAATSPDAVAVVAGTTTLTYGALRDRARALAHRLRARGVGPEVRVALCAERSAAMLVALLAILEAGGVYVPLDPGHPRERLALVLDDARPALVLASRSVADALPEAALATVAWLDALDAPLGPDDALTAMPVVHPAALAYVLYTSGSTGRPKGVGVSHAAVVNLLRTMARVPGLAATDRLVAVTTLAFDIAGLELWLPLTVGARTIVATREDAVDGRRLAALLAATEATVMQGTPSAWQLLLEAGWTPRSGFVALVGGEALPPTLADELLARGCAVWNLYGPTETTIWSSAQRVATTDAGVPIGRPVENTVFRVLDRDGQPVPPRAPGELFIGGAGVARGYVGRPGLTAERFVPDPFAREPGARMYRTGDTVRWTHDGALEYLGRGDQQVKLRGFRVELGEVEAALARHADVRECVVVVRGGAAGEGPRLVAYVALRRALGDAPDALRAHAGAALPPYMVPAQFVLLDALPRTPNGKLDRRALPDPVAGPAARAHEPPRPGLEATIAAVWCDVLGVARVGRGDHFFEHGGTSLLAMRVHARLEALVATPLAVVDLFAHPTVASLASYLAGGPAAPATTDPAALRERRAEAQRRGRTRRGR